MKVILATIFIVVNAEDIKIDNKTDNESKYIKQDYNHIINKVEQKVKNTFAYPIGLSYDDYLKDLIAKMREGQRIINYYGDHRNDLNDDNNLRKENIIKHHKAEHNITSCEDFGKNNRFHPKFLFYTTWVSFYVWPENDDFSLSETFLFEVPSAKLIQQYKELYGPHMETKINWKRPMLMMKMSGQNHLLVAVDLRGTFINIPEHAIPKLPESQYFKLPAHKLIIKIVDSYLGIMFCIPGEQFAYACAPSDNMPDVPKSRDEAAKTIGISTLT